MLSSCAAQVDAILIGAETLRQDNPRLTVRGVPGAETAVARRNHPVRKTATWRPFVHRSVRSTNFDLSTKVT